MPDGVIDCIIVTPRGFVFHSMPFGQLQDARGLVNATPRGTCVVFAIDTKDGRRINASDVLMMYACDPQYYQDLDGGADG